MSTIDILKNSLINVINNIDAGNSNLTEEQCIEIADFINRTTVNNKLSKYQACKYLGISRATFDRYVKSGLIPEGRKQQGFKEIFYLKQDLDDAKSKINNSRSNSSDISRA